MGLAASPCVPESRDHSKNAYMNEKAPAEPPVSGVDDSNDNSSRQALSRRPAMSSSRVAILLLLALASVAMCFVAAVPPHRDLRDAQRDPSEQGSFSAQLSSVPEKPLREVLRKCSTNKFKPGVFPDERTTLQAIQKENAGQATPVVELAKRQANSSSIGTGVSSTSVTIVTTTSTSTGTFTSTSASDSASDAASVTPTSIATTITSDGSTFTTSTLVTPSATGHSQTNAADSVAPSKTSGPKVSHTSVFLLTTTLPNGARSTITSTTVVAGSDLGTPAAATGATGTPALQNAAQANTLSWFMLIPAILGAIMTV